MFRGRIYEGIHTHYQIILSVLERCPLVRVSFKRENYLALIPISAQLCTFNFGGDARIWITQVVPEHLFRLKGCLSFNEQNPVGMGYNCTGAVAEIIISVPQVTDRRLLIVWIQKPCAELGVNIPKAAGVNQEFVGVCYSGLFWCDPVFKPRPCLAYGGCIVMLSLPLQSAQQCCI